ncbi:hypothetical protein C2S53_004965 [Perilla frutescens var. hirtella]|uniref:MULE transposase domain-containing protein n=1 Tax=Perilla frutescens var. hirtella TaxID=608512 RepID=A0AAD4PDI7_PERFH|nr:hypothetical protein C2S53_004965 [Perilla frutescens var. hirtella]
MLNKMRLRKESCSAFFYDFSIDKKDNLTCDFWVDPIARRNYDVFGDVVSFYCTYRTNKYEMIFAPFTSKYNHGKCVTFGVELMSGENQGCYIWAFKKFAKCMGRHPGMIITDQNPTMRISIKQCFPNTRHRLCIWHIMIEVLEKVPPYLKKDDYFMKRLNGVVWSDMIEPAIFKEKWNALMVDFELTETRWFKT